MAAFEQPAPRTKTASRCTPQTARGTHTFEIEGYSLHKGLGAGKFIRSAVFAVGGYDWCIRYYPDGVSMEECNESYVAVYLEFLTEKAQVRVIFDLRLKDQTTSKSTMSFATLFNSLDVCKSIFAFGSSKFMKWSELEASTFLQEDRLVIECDVMVFKEPMVLETTGTNLVEVMPSPNLSQDLAKLLETKVGADVTFKVEGEVIAAHALVLAMRSSVFNAELYGPLKEQREQDITIEDIQPDVFRALLYFIYTDSMLPSMADLDRDKRKELIQHLLVAADRYDVQGLKAVCEKSLCESLDVETVASMLTLADQQNCSKLKNACIDFMICPDRWDGVAASEGFCHLKRSCSNILVDVLERSVKSRKF
ncbi:unnamed protein product [Urochloa decumbens]|uniref:Uncharacterized protein n=1 Tax=Urochloa decumbens TaxID=240449 RepID=A0ABC9BZA0_9POAL